MTRSSPWGAPGGLDDPLRRGTSADLHGFRLLQRCHGDPSPLPPVSFSSISALHDLTDAQLRRVSSARASLNQLAAADLNSQRHRFAPQRGWPACTKMQDSVYHRIARRVVAAGPESNEPPEACLRSLLQSTDLYSQEPKNLAQYVPEHLKVTASTSQPKNAATLLAPNVAAATSRTIHFQI